MVSIRSSLRQRGPAQAACRGGWLHILLPAGLVVALVVGCDSGPRTGDVKGRVTFKGAPVREGLITFLNPTEGGGAEARMDDEGNYEIKRVVVGDYLVTISPLMVLKDTDPGKSPPAPVEKPAPNIPVK